MPERPGADPDPALIRTLRYTKVVSTEGGGSAFEDAELDLDERLVSPAFPPMLAAGLAPAAPVLFLRSKAFGAEPHPAPAEQWVILLRGQLDIEVSDGSRRRFAPGDLVYVADTTGRGHITIATGEPPLEGLFVVVDPG
jgi:hypothetical protein